MINICLFINYFKKKLNKISLDEGALIEPLAVGVHACIRGQVQGGSHCLITGAGFKISQFQF